MNSTLDRSASEGLPWKKVKLGRSTYEIAEVIAPLPVRWKFGRKKFRFVITRFENKAGRILPDGKKYKLFTTVTNDFTMGAKKTLMFYNRHGAEVKNFGNLKKSFNWAKLPCSDLNHNMVFMISCAMMFILYRHCIKTFGQKFSFISSRHQLTEFRLLFVSLVVAYDDLGEITIMTSDERIKEFVKIFKK
jgi:hypothetical protein